MESRKLICEVLCLLPKTAKRWDRDALAGDSKIRVMVGVPLALPRWRADVITASQVLPPTVVILNEY